ncbi:MAG TPA: glycosyltransferase family 39 protein [Candidatus Thiothrix moscowensis]|uniref:glycosyltransferase family 39 protein n=1 Tax=unclassified Thiothrix TaxID=2636184 RepID=UPI0025EE7AF9|nr:MULTISPECIES: glycosyltransferase family 39 protein [unclassified Thiothrix]HRJ51296.1 glycosyltransferase family 39 protein [Candidatus Thiothrix moscowensis]HRJ91649.1 glycosyltransferase family 39 protein [Candidatus Thiothrix moscowensis]
MFKMLKGELGLLILLILLVTLYRAWMVASSGLNLFVDEAQYWYWAQHLDWGYYSKPPVIAAIIAATTSVCGDSEFCVRSGSLLFYPLSTLVLFLLARRLFGATTALMAAVLFLTLPAVSLSSTLISTDVALFFCWTLALYAFVRVLASNAWGDWLLLGLAIGVGMLSKYTMGIFFVSALLYALFAQRLDLLRNVRAWVAVLLAALIFAPNLWWNWQHDFPTFQHTAEIAEIGSGLHWDGLADFLGGQFGVFGLLLFPLFVWAAFAWRGPHKVLLLSFALPFLLVISLQALLGYANANWAAPTYVAATLLVVVWLQGRGRWFALALLLNVLLGLLVYHPAPLNQWLDTDLHKRLKGWQQVGEQFHAIQRQYPDAILLASDRNILSEFAYYVQPEGLRGTSWNPGQLLRHHYDLVTRLDDKIGKDFLFVTPGGLPADMVVHFANTQSVGGLHATIHAKYRLDYQVYLLRGFKGVGK